MKIKMSKKGIFFTFIAVTLMAIFIVVYTPQADITLQKDTQAVKVRIDVLDNYLKDLEKSYFETVAKATAYKTMLSLILYMNSTGKYVTNFDTAFAEVFMNGTINNVPIDSITKAKIMDNATLSNWSKRIIETAKDTFNVNTSIQINNVTVNQTKPWNIDTKLSMNIAITSDVARWKRENVTVKTSISIEGFPDPYYLINTNGQYHNEIKKSSVEFNKWNISHAREHLRNGTYVHWQNSESPNFIMRFVNDTGNSTCCGIESFINPNKVSPSDQTESYVDYLFWAHKYKDQCSLLSNITNPATGQGLWDEFRYFKLDSDHVIRYNITSEYTSAAC